MKTNPKKDPHSPVAPRRATSDDLASPDPRLKAIIENTPNVAIETYDRDGRVLYWNKAAEAIFGWTSQEAVGKTLDELVLDETGAREFAELIRRLERTGRPSDPTVWTFHRKDGSKGTVYSTTFPVDLPDGSRQFVCMDVDVTERVEAEEARRAGDENLRIALEAASLGLWIWDVETDRVVWSEGLGPLVGLPKGHDPVAIEAFFRLIHPEDRRSLERLIGEVLEKGFDFDTEYRVLWPDGSVRWLSDKGRLIRDTTGRPLRMVGIASDVTARRRAEDERRRFEAQAAQAQRLESLGVLAGGIAHDFNNILMGVLGNAELLAESVPPDGPLRARVDAITTAARRAADLTQQMLAYAGKGRARSERIDLSRLVEEMTGLLSAVISKRADLRLDLEPGLPSFVGDSAQIRQVVMNLITNASDALRARDGTIVLRTRALGPEIADSPRSCTVLLEVEDSGCGMDEATLVRIFEPFFTTKFVGRGLGLAAVHGILTAHGGRIDVRSQVGRGTTIRVVIPCAGDAIFEAPDDAVGGPPEAPRYEGTVLVVDDEAAVRDVTVRILSRRGFEVITAVDGAAGLAALRENADRISAVLLDLTMPRMGGEEALRLIRESHPGLPVVLTSGYDEGERVARGGSDPMLVFLQKPFMPADLERSIADLIEKSRAN